MRYTAEEKAIVDAWPTVTAEDIENINNLFPHHLFFRSSKGADYMELWSSCCGRHEHYQILQRTEDNRHWDITAQRHNAKVQCPYCGRSATMKSLSKSGKRKSLKAYLLVMVLHSGQDAMYGDALCITKNYETEADLTAKPLYRCDSGYRFAMGHVMQIDHWGSAVYVTHERESLGRQKRVREPFQSGSMYGYIYPPYYVLNREVLDQHPAFRYSAYFTNWQYRPFGPRGYTQLFSDFVSYFTAYSIYPKQVEMLCKAGLWGPLTDMVVHRKKNAAALDWSEPDIRKAMRLTKAELKQFLQKRYPIAVLELRNYAERHWGKSWTLDNCARRLEDWGCNWRKIARFITKHRLSPRKLEEYLILQICFRDPDAFISLEDAFEIYRDYLNAAYEIGHCLEHSAVLYPDDLCQAHDDTTREQTRLHEKALSNQQAISTKERAEKYEFELDGMKIIFPKTAGAINREGTQLNHCVGGYAKRHIEGVLTILFLRWSDEPTTPYVTIEMRGNRINQIHGFNNDWAGQNPQQKHKEFLETWLRWLRAGSKRDADGIPILPKVRKRKNVAA